MSSTTPRLSLYMPADDGSEPLNVSTDINDNLEKIDASVGFVPATESTPPSAMYNGMGRYNTDSGVTSFWKSASSTWNQLLAAGSTFANDILVGAANKLGIGTTTPGAIVDGVLTSITAFPLLRFRQSSEANPRLQIDSDGIRLGKGSAVADVRIYRPADNQLAIQGSVSMNAGLSVTGGVATDTLNVSGTTTLGGGITGDLAVSGNLNVTGINKSEVRIKAADLARTSTTTPVADTSFDYNLDANSTYLVEMFCMVGGDPGGDFKTQWVVPAGATGPRYALAAASAATTVSSASMITVVVGFTASIISGTQATTVYSGHQEVLVITTTTAGLMQFQWSQGSSSTTATTLKAGSIMRVRKVA